MKRRGFLGVVAGLFAVPVVAKVPIAAGCVAPQGLEALEGEHVFYFGGAPELLASFDEEAFVADMAARMCNPPAIVGLSGDFLRQYEAEFTAAFKRQGRALRDAVTG